MENQEAKNYAKGTDESREAGSGDGGKIIIHTMPRRYMANLPTSSSAKSTGLLILILGFIFLIAALLVLYFYVLKKPAQIEVTKENDQAAEDMNKKATSSENVGDKKTPVTPADKNIDNGVSTSSVDNTATSSSDGSQATIDGGDAVIKKYPMANDSDKDGLSDIEEYLLGSSPNSQDTDGDNYPDGLEVFNLYDPGSKGRLVDSLSIEELVNEDYNFVMFIASLWTVNKVSNNDSLIVSLGKSQYIQIISQEKPTELSLDDWYTELFGVTEIHDSQKFKKGNWIGVINNNGLTYYLEHPNKKFIITLNYEIGDDTTLYYKSVFDMMLQSIAIKD